MVPAITGINRSTATKSAATIADRSTFSNGVRINPLSRSTATTTGTIRTISARTTARVINDPA